MGRREHSGLVVLNADRSDPYLARDSNGITTNLDLFSSTFFMITAIEEVRNPHLRDEHGRFTFVMSKWARYYINRPLINLYAETLRQWIEETYGVKVVSKRRFSVVVSHDIDLPFYYGRFGTEVSEMLNSVNGNGKYSGLSDLVRYLACHLGVHRDPYDTYSYLQKQEGKRGIPATYFIMLSRENTWGLNKKKYAKTLKEIHRKGNEIALHPGYESYDNLAFIKKEKAKLEELAGIRINGVRNHFLRFKMPDTFHLLSSLNLSYDASLGFPDREGFRCGICTPYNPFDICKRRPINIIEIPLIVMDGTLREYRNLTPEGALAAIEEVVEEVSSYGGTLTFNWHNTFLSENNKQWQGVYEKSLDYVVEHHAEFLTCEQIADQWRECWC